MHHADLNRLQLLAALAFDLRQRDLRLAAVARNATLARLSQLDLPPSLDCDDLAAMRQGVAYAAWADARRREINPLLAQQTVQVLQETDAARLAIGRKMAVQQLASKR